MIIERIEIGHFGMLTNTAMDFSDTVNIIEGGNEAGKSTVAAFIRYMLYGFETADAERGNLERQKRVQWQTGVADGRMVVRVRGKRYAIHRTTVLTENAGRPAYKEESTIIDLDTGAPAFGKSPAGEVFLGADRTLFENTAFLGTVGDASVSESAVRRSIENIIFSGSEKQNSREAMKKLDDKMEALIHKNGVGGIVSDLRHKEDELEHLLEVSSDDNRKILDKEAELHEIRAERAEAETRRDKLTELDAYYKNVMLIQTFDKLHDLEKEAEEKSEKYRAFTESETYRGFLPTEGYLSDLRAARAALAASERERAERRAAYEKLASAPGITKEIEGAIARADDLGGEEAVKRRAMGYNRGRTGRTVGAILLGLVFIAAALAQLAVTGAAARPVFRILIGAGGVLALGGGIALLVFALRDGRLLGRLAGEFGTGNHADLLGKLGVISEVRRRRDERRAALEEAERAMNDAVAKCDEDKHRLSALVVRWSEDELPSGAAADVFLDRLEGRIETFLAEKNRLFDEKNMTEITVKEIRRTLSDKSEIDIRAGVSPLKRKALAEINHDEIINGIADCKNTIAECDRESFRTESELDLLKNRAVDPGEIYTKIRRLDEQIAELSDKHKAYYLAYHAIEQASDSLRAEISPRLGAFATDLVGLMTDKKYTSLDVSDGLSVTFTDADGKPRRAELLSGGTQDLVYLAVRMALIDMLYGEKPPLVFDETFAHQDNLRAEAMMRAVVRMAQENCQSFVFTCRQREAALAANLQKNVGIFRLSAAEKTGDGAAAVKA